LRQELAATQAELASLQQQHTRELAAWEQSQRELQTQLESLQDAQQRWETERQALEISADNTPAAELAEQQARLDSEWEQLSAERDRVLALREELQTEREAFTQGRTDLTELRAELEEQKLRLQEQQEDLQAEQLRLQVLQEQYTSSPASEIESVADSSELTEADLPQPETETDEPDLSVENQTRIAVEADPVDSAFEQDETSPVEGWFSAEESEADSVAETEDSVSPFDFSELSQLLRPDTESQQIDRCLPEDNEQADTLDQTESADNEMIQDVDADSAVTEDSAEMAEDDDAADPPELGKLRQELAHMFGFKSLDHQHHEAAEDVEDSDSETDRAAEAEEATLSSFTSDEENETEQADAPLPAESLLTNSLLNSSVLAGYERDEDYDDDQAGVLAPALKSTGHASSQSQSTVTQTTPPGQPASHDVVVDDIEDADSVAAYMERLFARTGGRQDYTEPTTPEVRQKPAQTERRPTPAPVVPQSTAAPNESSLLPAETPVEKPRKLAPINRELMKKEIESLRDVANQNARTALATHAWKQVKIKMFASGVMTLVSAGAAAVLISSPYWSPISYFNYGLITLLLSGVSAIELFRSRLVLMRLKQARKQQSTPAPLALTGATEPAAVSDQDAQEPAVIVAEADSPETA